MVKTAFRLEQDRREDVCAAIAACALDARFVRRDDGGGRQIHDFDLVFDDGAVEALEVCSFTDSVVREQWNALDQIDVPAPTLKSSWTVSVVRGVMVKPLPRQVEPHIAVYERLGKTRFIAEDHFGLMNGGDPDLLAASASLISLGVRDALLTFTPAGEPPRVIIAASASGVGDSRLVNRVVQSVAFKRDNRLKLQRAEDARRRHIFVPVDPSAGVAWSVASGSAPATAPPLPSGVEVAWVIGANGRTLSYDRQTGWRSVAVPKSVWETPELWRA